MLFFPLAQVELNIFLVRGLDLVTLSQKRVLTQEILVYQTVSPRERVGLGMRLGWKTHQDRLPALIPLGLPVLLLFFVVAIFY